MEIDVLARPESVARKAAGVIAARSCFVVAISGGHTPWISFGWERYVGAGGKLTCMKTFGASAPLKELQTSRPPKNC